MNQTQLDTALAEIQFQATPEQMALKVTVTSIFSLISLIGALFVVCSILFINFYRPALGTRLSLRLTFWIALADVTYSIFAYVLQKQITSTATCAFLLWGYVEFTLLPIFLTATIGFNLMAIFVHDIANVVKYQRFYVPFSIGLSLIISLIPVIAGQFEVDPVVGACWYSATYTIHTIVWEICTLFLWIFLAVLYCIFAVSFVIYKLIRHEKYLMKSTNGTSHIVNRRTYRAMRRIVLYPLVPVLTQTFNCLCEFDTFVNRRLNFTLYFLSAVGPATVGLLNAIVFLFDPAVRQLFKGNTSSTTNSVSYHENENSIKPKLCDHDAQYPIDIPEDSHDWRKSYNIQMNVLDTKNSLTETSSVKLQSIDDVRETHVRWADHRNSFSPLTETPQVSQPSESTGRLHVMAYI
ncbi:hypothetical protein K493DRAFT_302536 [Basidiobolus meristosporus CBS 931.73]|uniref:G-protein coupled receptors family 2 profile 2 domain-containing protein n=1 Tax=Basidiobolus meristosporus CBS 931.73 TaxID=1314790 RepID=A0A1Y1Y6K1_9FUNG|nr:hypothetical protein K493DRAFT_302536 [Basidiobolus meristosporus CBS 931.73]|eukprot:ORX93647.1 hypothetical protein K493DRAFT_302536 [Basidiobolus meristosporus CBS 931.73]